MQTAHAAQFKKEIPLEKWAKDLNGPLSKEGILEATEHVERCSTSLTIGEMQTKTAPWYHLTPLSIADIQIVYKY